MTLRVTIKRTRIIEEKVITKVSCQSKEEAIVISEQLLTGEGAINWTYNKTLEIGNNKVEVIEVK